MRELRTTEHLIIKVATPGAFQGKRKGELAESNAQLVAKAVRIARELGCRITSPTEARQMPNIPPLRP